MFAAALAALTALIWLALLFGRGFYWLGRVRDDERVPAPERWPSVVAVIPARNEAAVIGEAVGSLLQQDYPGALAVIVVDDDSDDGTGAVAAAAGQGAPHGVTVLTGAVLPPGWTGKLWALKQGIAAAEQGAPDFLLLTDADIAHRPDSLSWLVAKAARDGTVLTSFMAKLRCKSLAERSHVPAFIYFFEMLYPFAWVRQPKARTAAAAGGCVLLKTEALRVAGGIESIRNALIDDCSLARRLKAVGPIWLGLTERVHSIRPYESFADVRQMISRSAYAQLNYSPLLLLGTLFGMFVTYLAAPLLALFGHGWPQWLGIAVWAAMALSFVPTLRFYRLSPLWGIALPGIAMLYALYTFDSAFKHWRRRGGQWKGRVHVNAPSLQ
ncbi:MAG TPA: glycosyltransferase [Pseudolabrys sp.]|uniref:glycosyltransferase n=1 Tax=Pseudolabrys sp. TaxID=1960880 RepID=UPI002DDD6CBB|nr:glycosyltransferase [Pseudolabrys sp.]HEV2628217.1 glycosyltransferase [Pseudolabrys sp.]